MRKILVNVRRILNKVKLLKEEKRSNNSKNIDKSQMFYLLRNKEAILIDVRSEQEYKEGHLNGAINIPDFMMYHRIEKIVPNKEKLIILYCQSGIRSKKIQDILEQMGYSNVFNLKGGLDELK